MTRRVSDRPLELGEKFIQHAGGVVKKLFLERGLRIVRIERQITYGSFDQVLKEMGAEREVGQVIAPLASDFNQHGGVIDVGVGDGNTQLNIASAAPAAGTDQNKLPLGQQLVQPADSATDVSHAGLIGKLAVAFQIHVNNMGDLGYLAIRNEAVGRKDHLVRGQILGDRDRPGVSTVALRTALQEIQVFAVVGELDVHGRAQLVL